MAEPHTPLVSYDPDYGLATFVGESGFTQIRMTEDQARALASIFSARFEVRVVIVRA